MNLDKLKGIVPDKTLLEIPTIITKFEINTPLRLAHCLSQCAHESGNFTVVLENLNYSADALIAFFKTEFDGDHNKIIDATERLHANTLARHPEAIANFVYANRMGNGDEKSGDGWKFRGRSDIQITGKNNYKLFSDFIGEDCVANPDLLITKYTLTAAAWFFWRNGLNKIADLGATDNVVTLITKKINGGINGIDDRILKFKKYYSLLT